MTIDDLLDVLRRGGLAAAERAVARATVLIGFTAAEPLWVELEDLRDAVIPPGAFFLLTARID